MRLILLVLAALSIAISGCSGPGRTLTPSDSNATPPPPTPTLAAAQSATASPSGAAAPPYAPAETLAQIVNVTLSDALRIEPAQISVRAGQMVTFQVTNLGALDHEFYLGDATTQAAHEAEMVILDGIMPPDAANAVSVEPGQTETLTYTFPAPAQWLAGCHVVNHYNGGMRATITVTD